MKILTNLALIFEKGGTTEIYLVNHDFNIESLQQEAKTDESAFFYLDGNRISGPYNCLLEAAEAMHFPDYFGNNWNAFEECIRDLEWIPAQGYIIFYSNFMKFAKKDPNQFKIALSIFQVAVDYWQGEKIPMYILLQNKDEQFSSNL